MPSSVLYNTISFSPLLTPSLSLPLRKLRKEETEDVEYILCRGIMRRRDKIYYEEIVSEFMGHEGGMEKWNLYYICIHVYIYIYI